MREFVLYIHGKDGAAAESVHYRPLFPTADVMGLDYTVTTPWGAREEFPALFRELAKNYSRVTLIANSIGAYFAMHALSGEAIDRAYFLSPIVDMGRLIHSMMGWAHVTEKMLSEKKEIVTDFGETLSWEYLIYVRTHPIQWHVPTWILAAEHDALTPCEEFQDFASAHGASLTIMPQGEHWFHTAEQMDFLDQWIKRCEKERNKEI